ncbi:hypothetical protein ACIP1U_11135 [Cupriavidus sp. NPDC089707]|uniref:hypothetical protein n=1 Tax=Cupriavidus sp. NPDC089707 TaxID=3363963 RepID=UPI00382D5F80
MSRPFPVRSATAGRQLPAWLVLVRKEQEEARRVRAVAVAYARASGGMVKVKTMAPALATSLDEVNAALQLAVDHEFLAARSEAAFCQAGVVAPPDSLTGETRSDFGAGC